mmetsp:Transcript_34385/g.95069  ORF Transcript_34385/g.95069 Transcript_34385/m.95069 type:complete len:233 (+) Transcript_34385:343-1041(+)
MDRRHVVRQPQGAAQGAPRRGAFAALVRLRLHWALRVAVRSRVASRTARAHPQRKRPSVKGRQSLAPSVRPPPRASLWSSPVNRPRAPPSRAPAVTRPTAAERQHRVPGSAAARASGRACRHFRPRAAAVGWRAGGPCRPAAATAARTLWRCPAPVPRRPRHRRLSRCCRTPPARLTAALQPARAVRPLAAGAASPRRAARPPSARTRPCPEGRATGRARPRSATQTAARTP